MNLWNLVARTHPVCLACCAHCGLPASVPCYREGSPSELVFCCRACRQVYDLMRELPGAKALNEDRSFASAD